MYHHCFTTVSHAGSVVYLPFRRCPPLPTGRDLSRAAFIRFLSFRVSVEVLLAKRHKVNIKTGSMTEWHTLVFIRGSHDGFTLALERSHVLWEERILLHDRPEVLLHSWRLLSYLLLFFRFVELFRPLRGSTKKGIHPLTQSLSDIFATPSTPGSPPFNRRLFIQVGTFKKSSAPHPRLGSISLGRTVNSSSPHAWER